MIDASGALAAGPGEYRTVHSCASTKEAKSAAAFSDEVTSPNAEFTETSVGDAKLISIGNNVWMASGVEFIPHDVTHYMLNGMKDGYKYTEKIGCIEIGNNVFIGSDVTVCPGVKIGDNTIIGAGAVVAKDLPPGNVWGGYPLDRLACLKTS